MLVDVMMLSVQIIWNITVVHLDEVLVLDVQHWQVYSQGRFELVRQDEETLVIERQSM